MSTDDCSLYSYTKRLVLVFRGLHRHQQHEQCQNSGNVCLRLFLAIKWTTTTLKELRTNRSHCWMFFSKAIFMGEMPIKCESCLRCDDIKSSKRY